MGARIVRSFVGLEPTPQIAAALAAGRAAGVGLYRGLNVESPTQLRVLSAALQAVRPEGDPPLIVALDQEGGQLQGLADGATPWPGNLALGATGSVALARRAGEAIGRELAAVGVNVVWAPVCDLLVDRNVVMGTRPFGSDPLEVGRMAAAMILGLQSAGVAATVKHLPGHGSARGDSHHELPLVEATAAAIRGRDLVPFALALRARPRLAMVAHLAVPALVGDATATTFSERIAIGLLRDELGFRGASVTDALNMGALGSLEAAPEHAVRAARAGFDLLLLLHEPALEERATDALQRAAIEGELSASSLAASARRVFGLRRWLAVRAERRPGLDVVGSVAHRALAREIAERSITLVRDRDQLLPLRSADDSAVLVLAPRPVDLTPADTTSYLRFGLADALVARGVAAEDRTVPLDPTTSDVAALRSLAGGRMVIVATVDATVHDGQAALVRALVADGRPVVAVAIRTPYDLDAYPEVGAYACSYGIQPPTIDALADALAGRLGFGGRLPVRLAGEAVAA